MSLIIRRGLRYFNLVWHAILTDTRNCQGSVGVFEILKPGLEIGIVWRL